MLFQSPSLVALLGLTLLLYYTFPKLRLGVLALVDLAFYGLPNPAHLPLFLGVSLVTYWCALRVGSRRGGWFFGLGLLVNAANLIFFKYALFFTRSLEGLAGMPLPALDGFLVRVVLPVGISFYTFQLVAYLVDVRRDRIAASRSFVEFWVFVSLFPKLVAGPIVRGSQLLPQLAAIKSVRFSNDRFSRGLVLLLVGLIKKLVVADTIAPAVNNLFAQGASLAGLAAWVAAYLYTFQIYFDFSAYSDMAVGIGSLLGLDLPQNFHTPYVSAGPGEFWRRWHITLSQWIRDYVYIPLGGSRVGLSRQLANLLLAMAFSGLWHGAGWTFVIWGVYHGLLCAGEKLLRVAGERLGRGGRVESPRPEVPGRARVAAALRRIGAVALTFHLVVVGWVLFRAADLPTGLAMLESMFTPSGFSPSSAGVSLVWIALVPVLYGLHLAEYLMRRNNAFLDFWWTRVPAPVRGLVYALGILLVMTFVGTEQSSFIYQRF